VNGGKGKRETIFLRFSRPTSEIPSAFDVSCSPRRATRETSIEAARDDDFRCVPRESGRIKIERERERETK